MPNILSGANMAFIGGGELCRQIIDLISSHDLAGKNPHIAGVADPNDQAEGRDLAENMGIFTTRDYTQLFAIEDLDILIDLIKDDALAEQIDKFRPPSVRFLDHYEFLSLWDLLQIEGGKRKNFEPPQRQSGFLCQGQGLF